MKKILLLGGSAQQVIAIETAKGLGYYTVLCDFLSDNPGQYVADKFYLISTTDKKAILDVAKNEQVAGILAYASDPAAPTAAFVAEKLGLPGNPYKSVEILCNKDKFREFLSKNGFNTPVAKGYSNIDEALCDVSLGVFQFPIIVKPVDSSGSKGATVIYDNNYVRNAVEFAFSFSRRNRIIIEEYIDKKHKYLIGGDIFVSKGKVVLWGLMNCHRDNEVNPLVPVGKSYPLQLNELDIENVKKTLQNLIEKLNIKNGPMNVELVVDKNNRVWPIDIGPRSGGNMIPDLLGYIFNVDVVELCVKVAIGDEIVISHDESQTYYATHNLHSKKIGILKDICFSAEIEKFIINKNIYKSSGDFVEYFDNASKAIGILFMKFSSRSEMMNILSNINNEIEIVM